MFFFVKIDSQIGSLLKNKAHLYDGKISKIPSSVKRFDRVNVVGLSKFLLSVEIYCTSCRTDPVVEIHWLEPKVESFGHFFSSAVTRFFKSASNDEEVSNLLPKVLSDLQVAVVFLLNST